VRFYAAVIRVEHADRTTDELVAALARLVPELSSSATVPTADEVRAIVESPATTVLVARNEHDVVVGCLTLALFRIPTGVRAWIEDVVVAEGARGQGVGEALTREAVRVAKDAGARTVDLTSRPEREAANRLYEKVGFRRRETNVYRYDLLD
jgi:ribosomal protein S18 acetylase RimI-like enzyme